MKKGERRSVPPFCGAFRFVYEIALSGRSISPPRCWFVIDEVSEAPSPRAERGLGVRSRVLHAGDQTLTPHTPVAPAEEGQQGEGKEEDGQRCAAGRAG